MATMKEIHNNHHGEGRGMTYDAMCGYCVDAPIQPSHVTGRNPLSKRFHERLAEVGRLHDKKQQDYGTNSDPFANVRSSEEWGIKPWVGALVRLNDKVKRLQKLATAGDLKNESAEDSMLDIATYALIALVLYEEGSQSIPISPTAVCPTCLYPEKYCSCGPDPLNK